MQFTSKMFKALLSAVTRSWLFALLALSWNLKVYLHPAPAANFDEFIARLQVIF